jgi:hypothetical protein
MTFITATSRECLSGDSSEARSFRYSAQPWVTKSWKLCWNAWEPHRASAHIPAGIGFWPYVGWDAFAQLNLTRTTLFGRQDPWSLLEVGVWNSGKHCHCYLCPCIKEPSATSFRLSQRVWDRRIYNIHTNTFIQTVRSRNPMDFYSGGARFEFWPAYILPQLPPNKYGLLFWHIDLLLGENREINNYTTAVTE